MSLINTFQQNGFITFPYNNDVMVFVAKMVRSWQRFCQLPEEKKSLFRYSDRPLLDGAGYEMKRKPGVTRDLKQNFHVTGAQLPELIDVAQMIGEDDCLVFIRQHQGLIELIAEMICPMLTQLDSEFTDWLGLEDEIFAGIEHWIVRYLHYFPGCPVGDPLATHHADKSGFTIYLYQNDAGVQYLDWGMRWKDLIIPFGQTVITPNLQMQYRTRCALTALCHRVLATKLTSEVGRWAIVLFIPLVNTPAINGKEDEKVRQQDRPAGFNYGLDYAALVPYFTQAA